MISKWIIIGVGLAVGITAIGLGLAIGGKAEDIIPDKCVGKICEDRCVGVHLYHTTCDPLTGECVLDGIAKMNDPDCGYTEPDIPPDPDLCTGVICENDCIGNHLYSYVCDPVTGDCVADKLIEINSPDCGYVCENGKKRCIGTTLYECQNNMWTAVETNSVTCGGTGEHIPDTGGYYFDVTDPVTGAVVPIYWTESTGQPDISSIEDLLEYRTASKYLVSRNTTQYLSHPEKLESYQQQYVNIASGTWVVIKYPDGTQVEYPYGEKTVVIVSKEQVYSTGEPILSPDEVNASTYHITSRVLFTLNKISGWSGWTWFDIPSESFVVTLRTDRYDGTGDLTTTHYMKNLLKNDGGWKYWGYRAFMSPEEVYKFIQYGFNDVPYQNEIISIETAGGDFSQIESWMNNMLFIKDNLSMVNTYTSTEEMENWYYNALILAFLHAGYVFPESPEKEGGG